jgi:ketosteroid isomerase-like protein
MTQRDPRIDLVEKLFAAWSSGNADAPKPYLSPDCILYDIVGGEHRGWATIRKFFAEGLALWPDLVLLPDQYWVNDKGVAVTWVMSATVQNDNDMFGPAAKGRKWRSEGMSYLEIENGVVTKEADYHNEAAIAKSLAVAK